MSVGIVFGASDGLLVVVDGVKSEPDPSSHSGRRVVSRVQRQFALSSSVPAAVVMTGQSSYAGSDSWQWAEDAIGPATNDGVPPTDARALARRVVQDLETVCAKDIVNRQKLGLGRGSGVHGLVAVAASPLLEGAAAGSVWEFSIDEDLTTSEPREVVGFNPPGTLFPLAIIPSVPAFQVRDQNAVLPADIIEDAFGDVVEEFTRRPLTEVLATVEATIVKVIQDYSATLERNGVGGTWTLIQLRPSEPPTCQSRDWGP